MIRKLTPRTKRIFSRCSMNFTIRRPCCTPSRRIFLNAPTSRRSRTAPMWTSSSLEQEGKLAGYGQVSLTWSTEAGGMVVLLEELYLRPEFQGKGLGSAYFSFVSEYYAGRAARFRLRGGAG